MQGNQYTQTPGGSNWNYDSPYTTPNLNQQQNWFGGNYGNQQGTAQTPQTTQQTASMSQRFVLPGRLINDISEVQISEIPMDGSCNVFPLRDFSKVYLKFWDNDGQFKTLCYTLVNDYNSHNVENQNQTQLDDMMSKITSLEKMMKSILRKSYRNNSKGGDNNAK